MSDNSKDKEFEQLSIFDILKMPNDVGKDIPSNELTTAIENRSDYLGRFGLRFLKNLRNMSRIFVCRGIFTIFVY